MTGVARWLDGIEEQAAGLLPPEIQAYFRRGAGQGLSAAEAAPAWDGFRLRPHILRDVSRCETSTTVLVDAAAGTGVEVYVDGGLRRGTHIFAVLALGARAVFVGRPALWALSLAGAAGVTRLIGELTAELVETMRLTGVPELPAIGRDLLHLPAEVSHSVGSPRVR